MSWLILLFIATGAGWWFWRFTRHWRHLERIIDDLAAGRQPATFVFHGGNRFRKLARGLETLAQEQKNRQKLSEEEKFNFEAILAGMVEGVVVVDGDHLIRLVNLSFCKLFDLKSPPVGQTVLGALREAAIEEMFRAALATGEPQAREISPPRQPPSHFAVNAVPLRDAEGEITGAVGVFHDITRLRKLEEVRREFIANVSHELRTPLSIFHGYLENLIDNPAMERGEIGEILAVMRKHSLRLNALLEDLLIIARLESGRERLEIVPLEAGPFLGEILRDWRLKFEGAGITAALEVQPGLPPFAVDAFRMEQVLNNLIDNAVKFTPAGGRVMLRAKEEEGRVLLSISDTGPGIPAADLPHVFEQFYRVEKARSRSAGGTGLGLSIVKHIVTLHGGTVEAESIPGQGATILLRLPIAR